ncbi:TraR/DksA C4-type zinc finger protein [Vibrio wakamikoensis]|jgi:DnaK suppressor protein|uniref:TraR/DksA family transcriptional regulator n=1 Tax=Vibrio wakamikoensis TaxID=2910251 RepID=UPI003D2072E8
MDFTTAKNITCSELAQVTQDLSTSKALLSAVTERVTDSCDVAGIAQQQAGIEQRMRRLVTRLSALEQTLISIDNYDFGLCQNCGEAVELARLQFDVTCRCCVTCQGIIEKKSHLYVD